MTVKVYLLSKEEGGRSKPIMNHFQSQMYCKTWDAPAMMQLPGDKDLIMPGEDFAVSMTVRKHIVSSLYLSICQCKTFAKDCQVIKLMLHVVMLLVRVMILNTVI